MRIFLALSFGIFLLTLLTCGCQKEHPATAPSVFIELENAEVEVACGQCQFRMEGDDCDLAIQFADKTYFVDGSSIDDHGDAHADNGLCNRVREAVVSGKMKNGRFSATKFELVPLEPKATNRR